jgi:hypothetical protein
VEIFEAPEGDIRTHNRAKGLESDDVLAIVAGDLRGIGFEIEKSKRGGGRLPRPVFFGEGGAPTLTYEIDGYCSSWRCGLEVEAGRAILGNAIFRDLFQAMVMVDVDHICLAVPNVYRYQSSGKTLASRYYDKTVAVADALYGHGRVKMPYGLTVIGY